VARGVGSLNPFVGTMMRPADASPSSKSVGDALTQVDLDSFTTLRSAERIAWQAVLDARDAAGT
jgi:hypothetical protein